MAKAMARFAVHRSLNCYHRYSLWSRLSRKPKAEMKKIQPGEFEVFFPSINPNGIHDKRALVFGGCTGVGLDCVKQLLNNGARAVMIADNDENQGKDLVVRFCEEYGPRRTSFIKTDVAHTVLLRHAYCSALKYFKGLDLVINHHKHLDGNNWEQQIDHNIKGIVRNTLLALEYMGTHNGGCGGVIVNVITTGGIQNICQNGVPLYVGAQHFTMGFDRCLAAQYYKRTGVKVLSLSAEEHDDDCDSMKDALVRLLSKANCGTIIT